MPVALVLLAAGVLSLSGCIYAIPALVEFVQPAPAVPDDYVAPSPVAIGTCPWAEPFVPTTPASAEALDVAEALALPEDLFWLLIDSVPAHPDEADFDDLASALAGCERSDVVAFEARLTVVLYALDGPENFDWIVENDPMGLHFASSDSFLYSRCATVMAGRAVWAAAVRHGTLEWGDDVDGVSEWLLYVGLSAAQAQGRSVDDFYDEVYSSIPLSYETGSNETLWGSRAQG